MKNGISTNKTLTDTNVTNLKAAGCEFVFRYYAAESTSFPEKILRPAEATRLAAAGISIATVYELGGGADGRISDFAKAKAIRDATVALTQAAAVQQPEGSAIYFAVDSDYTDESDVEDTILSYFTTIAAEFVKAGKNYPLGVYGSGFVCRRIRALCPAVKFAWLAESTGWKESKTYTGWDVKQFVSTTSFAGLSKSEYERCESPGGFGGWLPGNAGDTIPVLDDQPPVGGKSLTEAPPYPGRVIRMNASDTASVRLIQKQLKALGSGFVMEGDTQKPIEVDGIFGSDTEACVELFQIRHTDLFGEPLVADGEVGSLTWGALFGAAAVIPAGPPPAAGTLVARALEIAATQVGVREKPLGSNRGPEVEAYQESVGIDKGSYWCAAFLYWCFAQAAKELKVPNPVIKTGGTLDHWNKARKKEIPTVTQQEAKEDPGLVRPGMIFIYATSGGHGHTGIVERVEGGKLVTIEGNTNSDGSANGIGVFRRSGRKAADINRGFIAY